MTPVEAGPPLSYAESGKEKREEPIPVTNTQQYFGLESHLESVESLSGEDAVDIDNSALQSPDAPFIVMGRPHAGEYVPADLWGRMTEEGRRWMAVNDRGTERVFKSDKIASVGFKISRFAVDPNRPPTPQETKPGQPPGMVTWLAPNFGEAEINMEGPIYQEGQEPDATEVRDYVERTYLPYYNAMMASIGSLTDRRESDKQRVLVIDGHSFPTNNAFKPYYAHYGIENPREVTPLFIIGDQDGKSCDEDISTAFAEALERRVQELPAKNRDLIMQSIGGGIVGKNVPFKGVHNVKFYGERPQGVSAVQLEVNEHAYVDEEKDDYFTARYDNKRLAIVQRVVEQAALDLDPLLKGHE